MDFEVKNLRPRELCDHGSAEVGEGVWCQLKVHPPPCHPLDLLYLSLHLVIVTLLHLWFPVDGNVRLG